MDLNIVHNFFRSLDEDTLSFFYQGNFSDEITDKVINLSEYNITSRQEQAKLSNKVSFLMAECFQNIVRHGESAEIKANVQVPTGLFITRHVGNSYYITSANLIENTNIKYLSDKLEQINKLDKDKLKLLYMDVLENEGLSSKGGAGLGLVEMARKSGQKLEFHFEPFNDHFSYFYLQIRLKAENPNAANDDDYAIPIRNAKDLHKLMRERNMLVIHKGDYSQESVIPILRMLENNLRSDGETFKVRKKAFHMLVEILQNVSKHSLKVNGMHQGIFVLNIEAGHYIITTGNYIENSDIRPLKDGLARLGAMNREELVELYKTTLKEGKTTARGGAGLGLIDIARESTTPMKYEFVAVDDHKSFFLFSASIRENNNNQGI
jgi:hypothetical protein